MTNHKFVSPEKIVETIAKKYYSKEWGVDFAGAIHGGTRTRIWRDEFSTLLEAVRYGGRLQERVKNWRVEENPYNEDIKYIYLE